MTIRPWQRPSRCGFEGGCDRFFLGRLYEAARVDDDDVGFGRLIGHGVAIQLQEPVHILGIDRVLGASECDDVNVVHT